MVSPVIKYIIDKNICLKLDYKTFGNDFQVKQDKNTRKKSLLTYEKIKDKMRTIYHKTFYKAENNTNDL